MSDDDKIEFPEPAFITVPPQCTWEEFLQHSPAVQRDMLNSAAQFALQAHGYEHVDHTRTYVTMDTATGHYSAGCFVGVVLMSVGFSPATMYAVEQSTPCDLKDAQRTFKLPHWIYVALVAAQSVQDRQHPWGAAHAAFIGVLTVLQPPVSVDYRD